MRRFVTADHHFYHQRIIRYCNRPFHDVREMNAELERLWNEIVVPDDEVWHLGDFGFWKKDPWGLERLFKRLHGRKTLVYGSHDQGMEQLPWEAVIRGHHTLDGVVLVHDGDAFLKTMGPDYAERTVFCGHVHEVWKMRGNLLNCGVDVWWGRPVEWNRALAYWTDRFAYYKAHNRDA